MLVRRNRNHIEVWSDRSRSTLRARWRLQSRAIPPDLADRFTAAESEQIIARLTQYCCAGYEEISLDDCSRMSAEDFRDAATWWCRAVRWEYATPQDLATLLIVTVRLQAALKVAGIRFPRRHGTRKRLATASPSLSIASDKGQP